MSLVHTVQPDLRRKRINWQKVAVIVLFAVVPLFLLILFTYIPFAKMIQFSFYNMSYTKNKGFVGLDNYLKIFTKGEYVDAMLLSLYYMAGAVVQLALALFFASVLSLERIRGAGVYKAILFFPFLVNGIAIGYIFKYFYTRGFVLDSVLQAIGIPLDSLPYWLRDQSINNWSLVFTSLWKYCGQNMVLFIGAIASIDPTLYEAATIDGANRWQQFKAIILPGIKTVFMLNLILSITGSLSAFEPAYVVWTQGDMLRAFLTSASVVVVVVTVSVMMGSMLAYVLNRFRFPGNGLIRNLFMIATLIPGIAMQVTTYQIMKDLGFLNSIWGYMILMSGTDVISIYIFLQYFENLDGALDESAVLEGCTYFGVFFKILLPLTKPAIITVAVLKGVGVYNEYYSANLYLQSNTWRTISTALYSFSGPFKSSYNIICAGVLLTLIPSLVIFLFFQKQVYAGLASGSVKG